MSNAYFLKPTTSRRERQAKITEYLLLQIGARKNVETNMEIDKVDSLPESSDNILCDNVEVCELCTESDRGDTLGNGCGVSMRGNVYHPNLRAKIQIQGAN